MPGPILHVGISASCPHGAPMSVALGEARVMVSGAPVATVTDVYSYAGCPFQIPVGAGTKPQPCVTTQWAMPATRVLANGKPVMLVSSGGIALSAEQIPQGPAVISVVQSRVIAT
ncbi:MAG: hypothetical protein ACRBCK_11795 [Alphaproteobacteria bacterium]